MFGVRLLGARARASLRGAAVLCGGGAATASFCAQEGGGDLGCLNFDRDAPVAELVARFDAFARLGPEECTAEVAREAYGPLVGKTWRLLENENGEEKMRLDGEGLLKRKAMMLLPLTIRYALDGTRYHSDICAAKFVHVQEDWDLCGPPRTVEAKGTTVHQQYGITADARRPFIRKSEVSAYDVKSESVLTYEPSADGTRLKMTTWCAYPDLDTLCVYTMHMGWDDAPPPAAAAADGA